MWKMGWLVVVTGHLMSVEITPFDRAHTSFANLPVVNLNNVSEI